MRCLHWLCRNLPLGRGCRRHEASTRAFGSFGCSRCFRRRSFGRRFEASARAFYGVAPAVNRIQLIADTRPPRGRPSYRQSTVADTKPPRGHFMHQPRQAFVARCRGHEASARASPWLLMVGPASLERHRRGEIRPGDTNGGCERSPYVTAVHLFTCQVAHTTGTTWTRAVPRPGSPLNLSQRPSAPVRPPRPDPPSGRTACKPPWCPAPGHRRSAAHHTPRGPAGP